MGLKFALLINERRIAFFVIGERNNERQLIGLWEVPENNEIAKRHFAFTVDLEDLLKAKEWLAYHGIETKGAFGKDSSEPIVHSWSASAAIYFDDPDGNELEYHSYLPDEPINLGYVLTLSEWRNLKKSQIP